MNFLRTSLALVICFGLGTVVRADEEKVPLDKVPAKIKDAVKAKFPDAELVGAEKEKKDGKTVFELNIKNKGHKIEVTVSEDGKIISVEKEIALKDLPKAVAEAFEKKYPKANVKVVEEITEGEKMKYELLITIGGKTLEVTFDPTGKFLEEEAKKEAKKEEKKEEKKK